MSAAARGLGATEWSPGTPDGHPAGLKGFTTAHCKDCAGGGWGCEHSVEPRNMHKHEEPPPPHPEEAANMDPQGKSEDPKPLLVRGGDALRTLIARTPRCRLRPAAFFVSWQGVVTLAYRGFPPVLVQLKQAVSSMHPSLPRENPGSKWPKTSLGAVKDRKRLTPVQLEKLIAICKRENKSFEGEEAVPPIIVDRAALAIFECRSLERMVSWQEVDFAPELDNSEPAIEEVERVGRILSEADDPNYWWAASKDGNREAHYRDDHLGATLAFGLPLVEGARKEAVLLWQAVQRFRERVDAELPGMYAWFADCSLHVTLRAIMG